MNQSPISTFAKWQVKPGEKQNVLTLLSDVVAKSIEEDGNLFYKVFESTTEPNTLLLYEGYKNEDALAFHRKAEYFQQTVVGKIVPKLENREVIVTTEISFL